MPPEVNESGARDVAVSGRDRQPRTGQVQHSNVLMLIVYRQQKAGTTCTRFEAGTIRGSEAETVSSDLAHDPRREPPDEFPRSTRRELVEIDTATSSFFELKTGPGVTDQFRYAVAEIRFVPDHEYAALVIPLAKRSQQGLQ